MATKQTPIVKPENDIDLYNLANMYNDMRASKRKTAISEMLDEMACNHGYIWVENAWYYHNGQKCIRINYMDTCDACIREQEAEQEKEGRVIAKVAQKGDTIHYLEDGKLTEGRYTRHDRERGVLVWTPGGDLIGVSFKNIMNCTRPFIAPETKTVEDAYLSQIKAGDTIVASSRNTSHVLKVLEAGENTFIADTGIQFNRKTGISINMGTPLTVQIPHPAPAQPMTPERPAGYNIVETSQQNTTRDYQPGETFYIYGSANRPISASWARIPDGVYVTGNNPNSLKFDVHFRGRYYTFVVTPSALDASTIASYELTPLAGPIVWQPENVPVAPEVVEEPMIPEAIDRNYEAQLGDIRVNQAYNAGYYEVCTMEDSGWFARIVSDYRDIQAMLADGGFTLVRRKTAGRIRYTFYRQLEQPITPENVPPPVETTEAMNPNGGQPMTTLYQGKRTNDGVQVTYKTVNGPHKPLRHVNYHSPDGFSWGYGGSGPADLALSILAHHLGEYWVTGAYLRRLTLAKETPLCWTFHQDFKRHFIAPISGDEWEITSQEITEWLLQQNAEDKHA